MIKNYIKTAWSALRRNKMFMFISLFGISLTLTILVVGASFYDYLVVSNYPADHQNRILYFDRVNVQDNKSGNNRYYSTPSYYLLDNYVRTLETPIKVSIYSGLNQEVSGLINNKPAKLDIKYTDDAFWNFLNFKFLSGRPFNTKELDDAQRLAVISESLANEYFGTPEAAIGKLIQADRINYQITGVVKDVPTISRSAYANVFVPLTTSKSDLTKQALTGNNLSAMMLVNRKSEIKDLRTELQQSLDRIDFPVDGITSLQAGATTIKDVLFENGPVHGPAMYAIFTFVILTIIAIPSINLVNLNTTRISERLSEIGIRKSFGATKLALVNQFLVENIILTLIGGLIAFILSIMVLKVVQSSGVIPDYVFPIDVRIFFTGLGFCFVFGLISGFLPARRMARLQIVESLNKKGLC